MTPGDLAPVAERIAKQLAAAYPGDFQDGEQVAADLRDAFSTSAAFERSGQADAFWVGHFLREFHGWGMDIGVVRLLDTALSAGGAGRSNEPLEVLLDEVAPSLIQYSPATPGGRFVSVQSPQGLACGEIGELLRRALKSLRALRGGAK